ncbi:MAG: LysR family transcriptional regulator [Myxococcota bacterium]
MEAWDDLTVFLAVIRGGSASRAASALGVGVSTVTRRLDRLEASVRRPLFVRTPDGVRPTDAGLALLPHAEHAERAVLEGLAAVSSIDERPAGRVVVALPTDMVQLIVLPVLSEFTDRFPNLELQFDQGTGLADLTRLEADIAVRVVAPGEGE